MRARSRWSVGVMGFFFWLVGLVVLVYVVVKRLDDEESFARVICTECGTIGSPVRVTRGYFWLEVLLWLVFLLPGILYSIWRLATRYDACATCGRDALVPLD